MDEEPTQDGGYPEDARPSSSIEPDTNTENNDTNPEPNTESTAVPQLEPKSEPVPVNNIADSIVITQPAAPAAPTVTAAPQTQPEPANPEKTSPGIIVLQWLTYAFWGWTVLAMSILVIIVLTFFIVSSAEVGNAPLYSMAAVLVLLPISVVCDIFYMKHEPEKKTGAPSIIMIIHAVIFALFGIAALIAVVFSFVTLFTSAGGSELTRVSMFSAMIIAVLYALVFLRTILPKFLFKFRTLFIAVMVIIVGVICAMAIFGPTMEARLTMNDKLIESNLSTVADGVNSYATDNKQLPSDLNSVGLKNDAQKLVADNLVTYKKDTRASGYVDGYKTYYYQLCVNYKKASKYQDDYPSYSSSYNDDGGYDSYISTYSHAAGEVCYKVKAIDYDSYVDTYDKTYQQ